MQKSEHINELAGALAKAQAKIEAAPKDNIAKVRGKNREGGVVEYSYSYSTLADVWAACRAPLSENGLAVVQTVTTKGQAATIATMLAHASGQWISEEMTMLAADEKPQSLGSAITYARRYALGAIVGVVSEEDDDGNTANGNDHNTQRKQYQPRASSGNGRPSTQSQVAQALPIPPEEQLYARLSEALPPDWTEAEKEQWKGAHRAEIEKLPALFKNALVEEAKKVPVKA